jgi:hypothetical protein
MKKNKPEVVNIYYIGDDFYGKSGTTMSSIYLEGGYRTDWGRVNIALREGKEVRIRQATDAEMLAAYKELEKYRK